MSQSNMESPQQLSQGLSIRRFPVQPLAIDGDECVSSSEENGGQKGRGKGVGGGGGGEGGRGREGVKRSEKAASFESQVTFGKPGSKDGLLEPHNARRAGGEPTTKASVEGGKKSVEVEEMESGGRYYSSSSPGRRVGSHVVLERLSSAAIVAFVSLFLAIPNFPGAFADTPPQQDKEKPPVFLEPIPNVTVAVGRDASLTCTVDNLGQHKVAWIHLDRQMIVSIHNHVITRQSRFTVTHDSHKTWTLQVTGVLEEDRGHYMCQVNTAPMISQEGFLQVVVPPNIVDDNSSKSNIVVREKDNVTLECNGNGFPQPQIKWRREDSNPIATSDGRKVHQLDGPLLPLREVSRTHMGAYLCIASNGVPPSVSKRITLDVEFAPHMHVPNQLVGAPSATEVRLECFVEAHPRAITYWEFNDAMVMNTSRVTTQTLENGYKIHMILNIRDLQEIDFGMYKCISKNSIAETDGSITLNQTYRPTSPPQLKQQKTYINYNHDDNDNPYGNRERPGEQNHRRIETEDTSRRLEDEFEEKERRLMEDAIKKEQENQRLEEAFSNAGHVNEQATRITQTSDCSVVVASSGVIYLTHFLLDVIFCLLFSLH